MIEKTWKIFLTFIGVYLFAGLINYTANLFYQFYYIAIGKWQFSYFKIPSYKYFFLWWSDYGMWRLLL